MKKSNHGFYRAKFLLVIILCSFMSMGMSCQPGAYGLFWNILNWTTGTTLGGGWGDEASVDGTDTTGNPGDENLGPEIQAQFDPEAVTDDSISDIPFYKNGGFVEEKL